MAVSIRAARAEVIVTDYISTSIWELIRPEVLVAHVHSVRATSSRGGLQNVATFRPYRTYGPLGSPLTRAGDADSTELIGRRCEIQLVSNERTLTPREKQIHYGRVVSRSLERSENSEEVVFTSRFDDHMFGGPVRGMPTIRQREVAARRSIRKGELDDLEGVTIGGNIVFNPIMDGTLIPNRTFVNSGFLGVFQDQIPMFVDPNQIDRSLFTGDQAKLRVFRNFIGFIDIDARIEKFKAVGIAFWTVATAVYHLCWTLNPDEKHIENPDFNELVDIFDDAVPDDLGQYLVGARIPCGTSMVEAIRMICSPYGIDFWVDYYAPGKRRLKFAVINHYRSFELPVSPIGSVIDLNVDATPGINISIDSVDKVINEVEVFGSIPRIEVTLPLMPAWKEDEDGVDDSEIALESRVYREWVANESGEYSSLRESNSQPDLEKLFTFHLVRTLNPFLSLLARIFPWIFSSEIELPFIERRRRILPTLTSTLEGIPIGSIRGVDVQYKDETTEDWTNVEELTQEVDLLQHEIGIRFTGFTVPDAQFSPGGGSVDDPKKLKLNKDFQLRITGSIAGDAPIAMLAKRFLGSPATDPPDVQRAILKLKERFGLALIKSESPYESRFASNVGDGTLRAKTRDDLNQMLAIANSTLASWSSHTASGSAAIAYLDWFPPNGFSELGQNVTGIKNRGVSFESIGFDDKSAWPVVVGVTYDIDRATKTLTIDQFRRVITPQVSP